MARPAHAAKVGAFYDPALQVFRPQPVEAGTNGGDVAAVRDGAHRQFKVSGWRPTFHQFLPLMVIATFAALFHFRLEADFVVLWLVASAIVALSCKLAAERLAAGRWRADRTAGPADLRGWGRWPAGSRC